MIYFAPALYRHCPVCGGIQSTLSDPLAGPKAIKSSENRRVLLAIGAGEAMLVCCLGCLPSVVIEVLSRGSMHWGPK